MSDLNQRLANLSPAKKALLVERLKQQGHRPTAPSSIPVVSRQMAIPLSYAQQRLWFFMQLDPGSSAYNIPIVMELQGELNVAALQQACAQLINRHEILRTCFGQLEGQPVQLIQAQMPALPWQLTDLQAVAIADRGAEVEAIIQAEIQQGFDLTQLPLVRWHLVQLSESDYVFITVFHHIITDGWSMGIFFQELQHYYAANQQGILARLPALTIQYADYAAWQREWLQGETLQTQLDYWKKQLADAPPLLELPLDRSRPARQTFKGKIHRSYLGADLVAKLQDLCRQTGTTLFMVLDAAFALLLSCHSRQLDILIGTPIANRHRPEVAPLIGFFVNTLVLRHDLSDNPRFIDLLQQVKRNTLLGYQHQDLPFEQLVDVLKLERNLSYSPLFQVMFSFAPKGEIPNQLADLTLTPQILEVTTAKFDLNLSVQELESCLGAGWEYNTDLFDRATIERIAHQFELILRYIAQQPQALISQIPLLDESLWQQVVYDWNATQQVLPLPHGLHQGFEQQAQRTPNTVAVMTPMGSLTYAELEARSNQLAHYLQQQGVTPQTKIGICIEKSPAMLIGLFGILKSGAVYVPLDPSYPPERLGHMIEDAELGLLLSQAHLLDRLPVNRSMVHCLDRDWGAISMASTHPLNLPVDPDALAYVIYTSGSTGKPKGVMISHRGAVNTNFDINQRFDITDQDRVIGLASLSFDLSVYDIFGVLAVGGMIVLPNPVDNLNPAAWLDLMQTHQVTIWNTAPAVMEMLMGYVMAHGLTLPPSLRVVMLSGDAISVSLPNQIWQAGSRSINIYSLGGATEGSIWSIYYPITAVDPEWNSIPYGKPLGNQRFHILDTYLNPVPIGVPGELYIGGNGVALGYYNRPDLNSTKFIKDPFYPGGRLYKTGDLGRYNTDGTIQFLGRIDNQVKLRGFRIELGEIEAVLTQQAEIREALVLIRDVDGQRQNRQLCAYLVLHPGSVLEISTLRGRLQALLPEYMVPSGIMILPQFPLTANGKIDRATLPLPELQQQAAIVERVLPTNSMEQQIAQIWQQLLGLEVVGIYDNFFDLGGNSLLLVQVHVALQQQLDVTCTIVDLFQYPTIAALVQYLQQLGQEQTACEERTAERLARRDWVAQQRHRRQQIRQQQMF